MQQVKDFLEECDVLRGALRDVDISVYESETLFKRWTVNDILVHLHFWNLGVDQALEGGAGFETMIKEIRSAISAGGLRQYENGLVNERGTELLGLWWQQCKSMAERWQSVDPKHRIGWVGPDMSARSAISARQMETWAHGQAVFDLLGIERPESDRLRNIVFLGINAFGWSHSVRGLDIPETMPKLELVSPSGELWEFGEASAGCISGTAVEFCQVVTQTRNVLDTSLGIKGEIAQTWMENAQCFAGPAETPPSPASRFRSKAGTV